MAEYHPLPHLPKVRRLVTGHTAEGIAVFEHDDDLVPVSTQGGGTARESLSAAGFTLIHKSQGHPVTAQGDASELDVRNLRRTAGDGIVCEIVDFPPSGPDAKVYMHRNASLDYMVVLKGSIVAVLDNGVEKSLSEGDVFVQRGTMHGWKNTTSDYCRFMTVIVPSVPVRVGSTGEVLEVSKIPGLTD